MKLVHYVMQYNVDDSVAHLPRSAMKFRSLSSQLSTTEDELGP